MFNGDVGSSVWKGTKMDLQWDRREMKTAVRERAVTWNCIDKEQEAALRGQVRRRASQQRKGQGPLGN